jgi:RHS repeat-associated protein
VGHRGSGRVHSHRAGVRFPALLTSFFLLAGAALGGADVTPTGAYSARIPIELPPFRGLLPALAFEYDSQAGNGFLGVGWRLGGLSVIDARSATGGLPKGDATDRFWIDGVELIRCDASNARHAASPSCKYPSPAPLVAYTTRIESFKRIAFEPGTPAGRWIVWSKDGSTATYRAARDLLQWRIAETVDTLGNRVAYRYANLGLGASPEYPSEIEYGQTRIRFYWEPRMDSMSIAGKAGLVFIGHRLKSVDVQVENRRLRAYGLQYGASAGSGRSILLDLAHYGTNALIDSVGNVTGSTLPRATFVYDQQPNSGAWKAVSSPTIPLPAVPATALLDRYQYEAETLELGVDTSFLTGDFDGDGRTDSLLLLVKEDPTVATLANPRLTPQNARLETHVRLASQRWVRGTVPFQAPAHWVPNNPPQDGREQLVKAWVADYNGDGFDDLVLVGWENDTPTVSSSHLRLRLNTAISKGDGTFVLGQSQFTPTPWVTSTVWGRRSAAPESAPVCSPGDFDGNGRADFACMFQALATGIEGRHFLGVARANTTGGFNVSPTMTVADDPGVVLADDPTTTENEAGTGLPFETRRMVAGDVDGDGQTDLIVLDLNAADVSACAQLGTPTLNRPTCTIKYDLLTFVSHGNRFVTERVPTPWLREDFVHAVPGNLAAADLNGDGRADAVFLAGTMKGERQQKIRTIRTAIRQTDGNYALTSVTLAGALAAIEVQYVLGDANGDGRTDLLVATPLAPGEGVNCSAVTFRRAVLTTALANRNGAFNMPSRWDDCATGREVRDQWAEWTPLPLAMLQSGDTNGDGYSDFILPVIRPGVGTGLLAAVYDRVAQPGSTANRRWMTTDFNGDSRADFAAIVQQTNSLSVIALIGDTAGGYRRYVFPLGTFQNPSLRSWRFIDANGDGKTDLVHLECSTAPSSGACELSVQSFLSRGDGTFTREAVSRAPALPPGADAFALAAIRLGDVDGDGRSDLVHPLFDTDPANGVRSLRIRAIRSQGMSWTASLSPAVALTGLTAAQQAPVMALMNSLLSWKLGDFDGDGGIDLLHVVSLPNDAILTLLSMRGSDWLARSAVSIPPNVTGGWAAYRNPQSVHQWTVGDVNGDGLSDIVRRVRNDVSFAVHSIRSIGPAGWHNTIDFIATPLSPNSAREFASEQWHNTDLNGDGRGDFIYLESDGTTLSSTALHAGPAGFGSVDQRVIAGASPSAYDVSPRLQIADVEGNGNSALVYLDTAAGATAAVLVRRMEFAETRDLLVRSGSGGATVEVAHTPAGRYVAGTAIDLNCALPQGRVMHVVHTTTTRDGRSPAGDVTTYAYSCPAWSAAHRVMLGWREAVASKSATVNRPAFVARSFLDLTDACFTRVTTQGVYNTAGQYVGPRTIVGYVPSGDGPPFHCHVARINRLTHGSGAAATAVNSIASFRYDEFGNVISTVEDGLNGLARTTTRSFKHATGPYIVGAIAGEQLHDGIDSSARVLSARVYCYDDDTTFACTALPTKGLLTAVLDLREQGQRVSRAQYDAAGSPLSVTGANGQGVGFTYDPVDRIYPIAFTNSVTGSALEVEWDRVLGKPSEIRRLNGETTTYDYDEFGRMKKMVSPGGRTATRSYQNWGIADQQYVLDTLVDGTPDGLWTRQYLDGLGRTHTIERKSDRPGEILAQRITYGDASRYPYRVSRSSRWQRPGPFRARAYTSHFYDEAGRLVRTLLPDGATRRYTFEASGNRLTTTVVDETNQSTQSVTDAFMRLVEARSFEGSQIITTRYEYDGADQIAKVIDPNGNPTTYEWDLLGQVRKVIDPDLGTRTWTYDAVGNIETATDARGRTTRFVYDGLNRMTEKIDPTGRTVRWRYDEPTAQHGRGRLTSFVDLTAQGCGTDPSGSMSYDVSGRIATVSRCIKGYRATFGLAYDGLGRLRQITYPDGEVRTYEYNAAGSLARMPGILEIQERDASGRPTRLAYGNGITRQLTYDPNRDWLLQVTDRRATQVVFDAQYSYKPNGLIGTVKSQTNQENVVVHHDTVGRITSVTGSRAQSWAYDRAGNLISNSSLGTYTYPSQGPTACTYPGQPAGPCKQPHAAQSAGKFALRYDDNGLLSSMTDNDSGQMRSIDWTFDMLPSVIVDFDGTTTTYEYDAFGNRVAETTGTDTTIHFGGLARRSLSGPTNFYVAGERLVAAKALGNIQWFHHDRSGSIRARTDAAGQVMERLGYTPFGEPLVPSPAGAQPRRFAGEELGLGGLQLMGARLYDPRLNRFLSPDSVLPDALNTQAANRYSYNYNSPLAYIDPSGHQPMGITTSYYGSPQVAQSFDFIHTSWTLPGTFTPSQSAVTPTLPAPGPSFLFPNPGAVMDALTPERDTVYFAIGLGLDFWDHKEEGGFGAVVGGMQTLIPFGSLLHAELVPSALGLDFDEGQQAYYDLARGGVLAVGGIPKMISGFSALLLGTVPTGFGLGTAWTGAGTLVLAGGIGIELAGAVTIADGASDTIVGTVVMTKSGIYILRDRLGVVRYVGKAACFSNRACAHKATKPKHEFEKALEDITDEDVMRGAEQWYMEHCPTCTWNRIGSMGRKNKNFDWRVIDFIEWYLKKYNEMPPVLIK